MRLNLIDGDMATIDINGATVFISCTWDGTAHVTVMPAATHTTQTEQLSDRLHIKLARKPAAEPAAEGGVRR